MKTLQKILAFFLSITIALCFYPTPVAADGEPDLQARILALMEKYPEGMICTNSTPEFRITAICSPEIISAQGCWGFALIFVTDLYGLNRKQIIPCTWLEINRTFSSAYEKAPYTTARESLQIGDILATVNPSHAMVIIGMDSAGVLLAEGNSGGRIRYNRRISYETIDDHASYALRITAPEPQKSQEPQDPCSNFIDVLPGKFFYKSVQWAISQSPAITSGKDETHFAPNEPCTRGHSIRFLWNSLGQPQPTISECPFVDATQGKFYYDAMLWALENGITSGLDDSHFGPNEICSRGQAISLIWQALGRPAPTISECPFIDAKPESFYYKAILWGYETHIFSGIDETHAAPYDACSRGMFLTFLYRAMN
jgi:S-layer homology domain.